MKKHKNWSIGSVGIFFLTLASTLWSHNITFVHIGPTLSPYQHTALAQARLFNPGTTIYLLASTKALQPFLPICKKLKVQPITLESLPQTKEHKEFLRNFSKRTKYVGKFVRYTLERFLYLHDFMQEYQVEDLFHLENDVMLYVNLQELLPIFRTHYNSLAAVFDNDNRCIPSFLYSAHKNALQHLAHYFASHGADDYLDMQLLALYKDEFPELIGNLPMIMDEYAILNLLRTQTGKTPLNPYVYSNYCHEFCSLFDAAAFGQYLGGTHRNQGQPFINEDCLFDPSKLEYEWRYDREGRRVPYVRCGGEWYRINNLHIHSKKLDLFAS